jgi:glycosyltransferase involved in cell wall biosynthesis
MRKKILFFLDYYLPGYKAGGPIVSVESLVELLGEDANIQIMTRCHDLGDTEIFPGIIPGKTKSVGKAAVLYLPKNDYSFRTIIKKINEFSPDVIYLNSVFSFHFSIKILMLKKLKLIRFIPIIMAPRGEFSTGALILKPMKKKIFLFLSKIFNFYKSIIWQATSVHEEQDIKKIFGKKIKIAIAPDLPRFVRVKDNYVDKKRNELHIVFLSRISPKKNLLYAIECLQQLAHKNKKIIFDIYGPKEDPAYWNKCATRIQQLPNDIKVNYCGEIHPNHVHKTLNQYHLFFLPTLGENYGHVIFEALIAGCPVLISDQTPWRNLEALNIGWDLNLVEKNHFVNRIREMLVIEGQDFLKYQQNCKAYAKKILLDEKNLDSNRHLFLAE